MSNENIAAPALEAVSAARFNSFEDCAKVEEVADAWGVSRETVRNLCRTGALPSAHMGRRLYIPKDAVTAYMNAQIEAAQAAMGA